MDRSHLGELIRIQRGKKNMTQEQLASGICSPGTLIKYENGNSTPSWEVVIELTNKLGHEFIEILSFSNNSDPITHYYTFEELRLLYENKQFEQLYLQSQEVLDLSTISVLQRQILLWYIGICIAVLEGDYNKSRLLFIQSLSLTKEQDIPECLNSFCTRQELHICNSFSMTYVNEKKFNVAKSIFEDLKKNIEYYQSLPNDSLYMKIIYNLTKCCTNLGLHEEGFRICKKGIQYAERKYITRSLAELYFELANCYELIGDEVKRNNSFKKWALLYELLGKKNIVKAKKEYLSNKFNINFIEIA